ncbi:hypothetical protein L6164_023030 [Bauhinia variegata]|uniref:Uncharacterized protein n=1 Tax=Bauhinia variegata TaxID=167791 RepID=A0ACB9MHF4_BAUVA|nr:hypothetical protein L6164_023030 [Bauhinia variegata]
MAALSVGHHCHNRKGPNRELRNRNRPRIVILSSFQGRGPVNDSNPGEKKDLGGKLSLLKLVDGFQNLGKRVKQNLSPQQKGDWKDLLLMSLSFAVYVYISQKLVSTYCAWSSMPKQLW